MAFRFCRFSSDKISVLFFGQLLPAMSHPFQEQDRTTRGEGGDTGNIFFGKVLVGEGARLHAIARLPLWPPSVRNALYSLRCQPLVPRNVTYFLQHFDILAALHPNISFQARGVLSVESTRDKSQTSTSTQFLDGKFKRWNFPSLVLKSPFQMRFATKACNLPFFNSWTLSSGNGLS